VATKQVNIDIIAKDKTRQAMRSATVGLNNLRQSVFNLQNALVGIGGALVAKSFLDTARETERLQVRFKFLFADVREGEKAFKGLVKFASEVPFSLEEIQRGAGNLAVVSKDAEEMNRLLAMTGDLAVASGLDFQTTAEQLQRVFSSGINSADLFRERGVREMLDFEAGVAVSAEKSKQHIINIFEEGSKSFVGGSKIMATTFDGVVSMIGDKVRIFKQAVMDASPFEALKASAQVLDGELTKNFGSIEKSAEAIGQAITATTVRTLLFATEIIDTFKPTFKFIGDSIAGLVNFARALPAPFDTIGVIGFLMLGVKGKLLVGVIAGVMNSINKIMAEVMDATASMQEQLNKITLFRSQESIDEVAESVRALREQAENLRNPVKEMGDNFDDFGDKSKIVFKNLQVEIDKSRVKEDSLVFSFVEQLKAVDALMEKNREASKVATESSNARATALDKEKKDVEEVTGLYANFAKGFKDAVDKQKDMFKQMQDIGTSAFDKLKTSLTDFVMTGKLSFADLGTFVIRSMVEMLVGEAIKTAMKGSLAMFKADALKKAFISLYEGAMKTFASIPFPFNVVAVGGALAFGAGIINKIKGFEKGGRPPVGQPSIVGEKGAELFVPDQAGTVVPNDKLGMNKNVTVNFNINTVDARGFNELLVNSRGTIVNLINNAMNEKGRMAVI
tara:strand:+ start:240 stop:2273 length:2034 start_codon:yes stop_codon:yes gene_type:complete